MVLFCHTCNTEVEVSGDVCPAGHALARGEIHSLRAEVERAFEEARAQIADVLGASVSKVRVPPPPPPVHDVSGHTAPEAELPTVEGLLERHYSEEALKTLAMPAPPGRDPIAAFAPAPRMDWGPAEKASLRRRNGRGGSDAPG